MSKQRKKSWFQRQNTLIRSLLCATLALLTTLSIPAWSIPNLPASPQVITQVNNAQSLLQQGIAYYQAGNYPKASETWQQALKAFIANGESLNQAFVLSNLSLAYQHLGQLEDAENAITQSLNLLQTIPLQTNNQTYAEVYAKALNTQARLYWAKGQLQEAFTTWQQAAIQYHRANNESGRIGSLINQAQALQGMGLHLKAEEKLQEINLKLEQQSDTSLQATGWLNSGKALRRIGKLTKPNNSPENEFDGSLEVLEKSLAAARSSNNQNLETSALIELGNTQKALANRATAMGKKDEALDFVDKALSSYQNAVKQASNESFWQLQAQLNLLSLLIETEQKLPARELINPIQKTIASLPISRTSIYAQLNFARSLICFQTPSENTNSPLCNKAQPLPPIKDKQSLKDVDLPSMEVIEQILRNIIQKSEKIKDLPAQSYGWGELGGLYELEEKWDDALRFTEKALRISENQQRTTPELSYRWEWQLGRIFKQQGKNEAAIAAYNRAIQALDFIRGDLRSINPEIQFDFRDNVEPVYRRLVDLLLTTEGNTQPSQNNLVSAVGKIDALQLAELENFLGCDLSTNLQMEQDINRIDQKAAFIYPIILEDRLEIIFKLPEQPLQLSTKNLPRQEVEKILTSLRTALVEGDAGAITKEGAIVYQWLIKPFETQLESSQVNTLVFVLDGELRNIPMSVLYDQDNDLYLLEKDYALALLPTSQRLFDLSSLPESGQVLGAGISEALNVGELEFKALKAEQEFDSVEGQAPSQILLNSQFNQPNLKQNIESGNFAIVHLVTHGNFSSDPEETYLLAYDTEGNQGVLLRTNDLNNLLRGENQERARDIELLVLSACKTAEGDNRATLGLAGLAVRAGARSTLATLWQVGDDSTIELMKEFYSVLYDEEGITKAQALHQAQKALLDKPQYQNPSSWAPYVLVGNWQ